MHPAEPDMQALQRHWADVLDDKEIGLKNLHNALYAPLLHYATTLLQNEAQAEDLLQEVFIKAWVVRHKTGNITHVKAWFYTLLRRKILNQIRNKKQGVKRFRLLRGETINVEFSAEDIVMKREQEAERRQQVLELLNQLPKRQNRSFFSSISTIWSTKRSRKLYASTTKVGKPGLQSHQFFAQKAAQPNC